MRAASDAHGRSSRLAAPARICSAPEPGQPGNDVTGIEVANGMRRFKDVDFTTCRAAPHPFIVKVKEHPWGWAMAKRILVVENADAILEPFDIDELVSIVSQLIDGGVARTDGATP